MRKRYRFDLRGFEVLTIAVPDGLASARGSEYFPLIAEVQP
ncbi:hypothetical protein [Accumulibacter sp.]|nr:hypothetical protein [Accumulibacter sp.]HRF06986.1 hypothetical protein [Accumulibacter sp.]